MRVKSASVFLALSIITASPALAWNHAFTRGLDLYSATDNGATIRLVCDPNRVYGGTETMVMVVLGDQSDINAPATLSFPNGQSVSGTLVHGRLAKRDLDETQWQTLLDGFRDMDQLDLRVGEDTRQMNLGEPASFTCL